MATIIQSPDSLSLSGNLKKYILSSGSVITFALKDGSTVLLDATYEPGADGRVTIDVRDIIEARLKYTISHERFYVQSGIAKTFTATIDGVETTFRAIRTGISNLADTPTNWLSGNFLTWQPLNKQVTYYSPEWITYYATVESTMKLRAYFNDGTSQAITLGSMSAGTAYTANVQYSVVAGQLGQLYPQHYEVYVENLSGNRLTYIQCYYYSEVKSEQEQWFLFENSLGGLDTIRAYGDTDFTGDYDHKVAQSGDDSFEYDIDTNRKYNKNTGYINEYERRWLLDFFPSRAKYIYAGSAIRQITVTESDVKYTASDLPSSYNFVFLFSDVSTFLNLIRNEEHIPENIIIPDIDSPDFSLPPRLSEYPHIQLHEGVILPAFDPHSDKPAVTTIGAILNAAAIDIIARIQAGEAGEFVDVLRSNDPRDPSDFNVFAAYRTLLEIAKAIEALKLDETYLSKISADTAKELITFLKGINVSETSNLETLIVQKFATILGGMEVSGDALFKNLARFVEGLQIGESFVPGIVTGSGGRIDGKGNAELESLILRRWLEVPEFRYNRVDINIGDKWRAAGAGVFESVDTENRIITLKLEEGEIGTFQYDDICMGIFHSYNSSENATEDTDDSRGNRTFAGFATSYFRIIQEMDEKRSRLRYELRPGTTMHPSAFMNAAAYGNFSVKERQTSVYETRTYQRYLRNVNDWEFSINNIAAQFGDLSNLNVFGLEMSGYSAYLNNVYFTGIIYQLQQQIQDEIAKNQVGAKNLLREYDIRFAFKYWGGTGQFIDVDIDNLLVLLQSENNSLIISENGILIDLS